jgi:hypothetical protein
VGLVDFWKFQLCHFSLFTNRLYRVYMEVPAKFVWNVPWVNLSQNNQTYLSPKLKSFRDMDKRSFKGSKLLHIY